MNNISLQPGDLIFERSYSLLGLCIRTVTKSWANHVALYIGNNEVIEANPGGVKINNVNKYTKPLLRKVRFYRINTDENKLNNMIKYAKEMNEYQYDYLQIFSLFFLYITNLDKKIPGFQSNKYTICSELINVAGYKAGINFTEKFSPNVTPDDLLNSSLIYEIN
jgi:uncharacterized protein YycO